MRLEVALLSGRLIAGAVLCMLIVTAASGFDTEAREVDLNQDGCLERIRVELVDSKVIVRSESGAVIAQADGLASDEAAAIRDINGDGLPDLAAGERLLVDGRTLAGAAWRDYTGFEETWNTGSALRNIWDSEVDDLDEDGATEIVGHAYYYPGTLVRVFENDSNNSFTETWASTEQGTPSIVALGIGETDGDGQAEVLAGVAGSVGNLYMWENVGDNAYETRPLSFQMGWQVRDIHVGDTDSDGSKEFVGVGSSSTEGGTLKIFEHIGAVGQNLYTTVHTYDTISYLFGCEIGDADNDGNMEILLNVGGWAGFPTYIRRIEYNPDIEDWEHKLFEASTTGLPLSAEIGDFDQDGDNELAIGSVEVIHVYESYSDDTFTHVWSSDFFIPGNVMDLTKGPTNEFGYPTLASCSFEGQVDIFGYDGDGYRRFMDTPLSVGDPLRSIYLGLFDGIVDPFDDLILARSGSDLVSVFEETFEVVVDWPLIDAALGFELIGNPLRAGTTIRFSSLTDVGPPLLCIYDLRGRLVKEFDTAQQEGSHQVVSWDGRDAEGSALPTGVYLMKLRTGHLERTAKISILR